MKFVKWLGLATLTLSLGACGGSSSGASGLQVRVLNAVPNQTGGVNVSVGTTVVMAGGSFGSFTGYVSCSSGTAVPLILSSSAGATLAQPTASFLTNSHYTVYASNNAAGTPTLFALQETEPAPTGGNVTINVVDLSPTAGGVDVYIGAPGAALTTPAFSAMQFQGSSNTTIAASTYQVTFTATGTTNVIASYTTGSLAAGAAPRYVLIDSSTGAAPRSVVAMTDAA